MPLVDLIDRTLHRERLSGDRYQREKHKQTYFEQLAQLPDGTFIHLPENPTPYLALGNILLPWSMVGYGDPIARPVTTVQVLTPRSIVNTLAHGYRPVLHATARMFADC
jgi:hypothetical protein